MDDNTFLLQEPEDSGGAPPAAPLFLIHDGGGTVFQYFSLGDLARPVYAIGNPRYESGEPWTGGIPEMARAYAEMVREALPPGGGDQVILGGWSLGGLIALELAHILSIQPTTATATTPSQPQLQVLGVVMIDSAHPRISRDEDKDSMPTFQPETKPHVRENITRCFREATRIIAAYEPPRDWAEEGMRAVLLRAREGRRVGGKNDGEEEDGMMGWRDYAGGRVVNEDDVVEIAGSHFTVFEKGNVDSVTRALKRSCDALQRGRMCRVERKK